MNKTRKCVGKESFLRMNYLYQLSNQSSKRGQFTAANLYSHLIIAISKKAVQRIEPEVKRSICKGCHQLLIPGVSCKVRIRKKMVNYTCNMCDKLKCYKTSKDYKVWVEKPEAIIEVLDYRINK